MGPRGGRTPSAPSQEMTVTASIHWPWLPIQNSQDQARERTFNLLQSNPISTFRASLERVPEGSNRGQPQLFHSTRARSNADFLRDPQTTAPCSPHSAAHTPHPTYFLSVPRSPAFAGPPLKLHTPLGGSQGREGSQGVWPFVILPSVLLVGPNPFQRPRDSGALRPETIPDPRGGIVLSVSNVFGRGCANSVTGVSGPPKPSPAGLDSLSLENPFSHHPRAAGALGWMEGRESRLPGRTDRLWLRGPPT